VIRPIIYVALTYDHRIVDGREAVTFPQAATNGTMDAKRSSLDALARQADQTLSEGATEESYVTIHGDSQEPAGLQLVEGESGRDRDRTDDLYRVKVSGVVYLTHSSWFSLVGTGGYCTVFGAYCSQVVPKFQ
jgi:hypothetical protein